MKKLGRGIARISDLLLAQVAPRAEAGAVVCVPMHTHEPCCVVMGARPNAGWVVRDQATRGWCYCDTYGGEC
jgi:hypothetical protein